MDSQLHVELAVFVRAMLIECNNIRQTPLNGKKHLILNTLGNDPAEYQRIAFQNMTRDRRPPDMLYLFEIKIYEQNAKSIFEKIL